jgi:hypothetical protein
MTFVADVAVSQLASRSELVKSNSSQWIAMFPRQRQVMQTSAVPRPPM